ncbi:hypothetical protein MKW98_019983 [Papaver atlanticum]|uniref:Uncharacterized protein n=1 Tax=Papaver atlanticum TaxID=357466 RepID=A0AAD4X694_9MAGN|nr:hypothetical protein MKW98_019983 [Papaver atlanticum]
MEDIDRELHAVRIDNGACNYSFFKCALVRNKGSGCMPHRTILISFSAGIGEPSTSYGKAQKFKNIKLIGENHRI